MLIIMNYNKSSISVLFLGCHKTDSVYTVDQCEYSRQRMVCISDRTEQDYMTVHPDTQSSGVKLIHDFCNFQFLYLDCG